MNMKDKLTKNGRKSLFYKTRKYFVISMFAVLLGVGVTLTTYFSVSATVKAEEQQRLLEEEESNSEVLSFAEETNENDF